MAAAIANSLRQTRERSLESQEKLRISEERSKYILESMQRRFFRSIRNYDHYGGK